MTDPTTHERHGFYDHEDDDGFHYATCMCGWKGPPVPDVEDAADTYGDHRAASVVPPEPASHDTQRTAVRWHQARFPNAEMTNVALKLCEEAAEVGKAINGVVGVNSATGGGDVGEEAADVVIALWVLLGRWFPDVDLRAAIDAKLARLTDPESDHPAALVAVAAVDGEAPPEPASHDTPDIHGFTDAEHDMLCELVRRNPDRVAQVLGFFRDAAVAAVDGEAPAT